MNFLNDFIIFSLVDLKINLFVIFLKLVVKNQFSRITFEENRLINNMKLIHKNDVSIENCRFSEYRRKEAAISFR